MWFTFGEILSNIVKTMKTGKNASFRNVVERHRSVTLFSFLDVQIAWLQTVGRDGTAQQQFFPLPLRTGYSPAVGYVRTHLRLRVVA